MEIKQKLMLSKKEILLSKLENMFMESHKDFNLSRRESEIFWLIYNLSLNDSDLRINNKEINEIILQKLGDNLTLAHLRNILNNLVKNEFIKATTEYVNTEQGRKSARPIPFNHEMAKFTEDGLNEIIKSISEMSFSDLNLAAKRKIEENFRDRVLNNLGSFHADLDKMKKPEKRGKKPRYYYFEMDIIVKMIEQKQRQFINEMKTNKYGFTLNENDVNRLLRSELRPEILSLIYFENTNMKKFYHHVLTSEEQEFVNKFGKKNTIQRFKSKPQMPEQKVRRLIKELLRKNILSEIILTPDNIDTYELVDLCKNLKKNEKVYLKNTHDINLRSFIKEIAEHHLKLVNILYKFIEIHELFEEPNKSIEIENTKSIQSPVEEFFQTIRTNIKSIDMIEKEFNKLYIYKNLFDKVNLSLIIFEEGFLKEFNEAAQRVFKLSDYDIHEFTFRDLIFNEDITLISENGSKELLLEDFVLSPILDHQWSGNVMMVDKLTNKRRIHQLNIIHMVENNQIQIVSIELKETDIY